MMSVNANRVTCDCSTGKRKNSAVMKERKILNVDQKGPNVDSPGAVPKKKISAEA